MRAVRVGVLDGGVDVPAGVTVMERRAFDLDAGESVVSRPGGVSGSRHGNRVVEIIAGLYPGVAILDAQVFSSTASSSAAVVAAGLDWLVDAKAEIVNMSFGLRADREVLRSACARAVAGGIVLVAATPASGGRVFPSAYPGVIRVTGDARCGVGLYTEFANQRVDFGACNGGLNHEPHTSGGGASLAVAHVVAYLAVQLAQGRKPIEAVGALREACRFRGREHRCQGETR